MKIKRATIKNFGEIKKLSKKYDFEVSRDWKDLIASNSKKMFILLDSGRIVGFSGLIEHGWNNTIQISNIFVRPNYRKKGLGTKLVQRCVDEAKKTSFRCLIAEAPSPTPVRKLYEKLGFRKCGYNDRYYSNGGEKICVWMSFDLK